MSYTEKIGVESTAPKIDTSKAEIRQVLGEPRPPAGRRPSGQISRPGTALFNGMVSEKGNPSSLRGRRKYKTFATMYYKCPVIQSSMKALQRYTGSLKAKFNPANDTEEAQNIARFFEEAITKDPITSFSMINQRLTMALYMGFSLQEIVTRRRPDGMLTIDDIVEIPQSTVYKWDRRGSKIFGVEQMVDYGGLNNNVYIPMDRMIYIVDNSVKDSPEGEGMARTIADPAHNLMTLIDIEMGAHLNDTVGILTGWGPRSALANEYKKENPQATPEEINTYVDAAMKPMDDFLESRKQGKKVSYYQGDSAIYEGKGAQGDDKFAAAARQEFIELFQGSGVGLTPSRVAVQEHSRAIAKTFGTEIQFIGDGSAGSLALAETKNKDFNILIDQIANLNIREYNRKVVPYLGFLNGINPDLYPNVEIDSIQSAPTEEKINGYKVMVDGNQVLASDPIIDEYRVMIGFSPRPVEIKTKMEEQEQQFMANQQAAADASNNQQPNNPSQPNEGDE